MIYITFLDNEISSTKNIKLCKCIFINIRIFIITLR